jgi:hypothetical protein
MGIESAIGGLAAGCGELQFQAIIYIVLMITNSQQNIFIGGFLLISAVRVFFH